MEGRTLYRHAVANAVAFARWHPGKWHGLPKLYAGRTKAACAALRLRKKHPEYEFRGFDFVTPEGALCGRVYVRKGEES